MQKSEKYTHPLSQANAAQLNDSDEGGLNLGQIGAVLRRRILLILGITGFLATAAVLKAETDPPVYLGTFEILTRPVTGESKVIQDVPQALGDEDAAGKLNNTTIQVLQSHRVLDPIIEKLQPKYPDLTYQSLVDSLVIQPAVKNGQILQVQYTDDDQQKVIDVSTLLADAYLKYSLQDRQSDIDQAIKFVIEQRKPLDERVKYWQNQLRNLRWENSLIDPAQKANELSGQIASFRQEQINNRVEIEELVARYEDLRRELVQQPGERAGNSVLSENARYQRILDQIQTADIEIKQKSAVFTDDNPAMETLRQRKAYLLPLLAQEEMRVQRDFQSRIRSLIARDRALEDKIKNLNNSVRELATISRNHDNIQRELQIANNGLTQFTAKQQALEIEKSQKQQPWSLLDPKLTEVNEPATVSDSAKRNLALGGILGLLLGVGAALVVDKLSDIFYSAQELKETTRLPLLGTVPLRKELEGAGANVSRGVQQPLRASFFEVFRSLYTNILLLGSDTAIRSLVISSAGQGDGKSTIAIQLAQAAAAMGQRVLLVDANLRCPSLHNRVGLMNIQGLTDVISQDLDWHNVIERSPIEENLFVMTAGPIPPDSVRLLASHKMQDLMNDLQASFDLVIYDTPPLLGFADAYLLANNTNGIVLVAGLGKLKRTALQQVLEEIKISGTPFLGMIANKSKDATPVSHNYYQQYYKQSSSAERVSVEVVNESNSSATSALRRTRRP
ncbi:polysaccharide biosynthesis tyrosine autokinase [Nostocaceae cyanobacterium CENA369]|uniref:non-specific protein-tyrosine kinase n=1 Tax=Dendronalium phyllosphericum CENA369 TaxID=1725256 RepID=A0A8J7LF24_9NOST|nr:polysaccharide biosynthesis tyrosine autokinase [Dendronalium phyllosphericum]MBH8571539.1 polysaccharide biosynthesis tyrosine autokinase [Dendronalium phyllosphericum CENA369]